MCIFNCKNTLRPLELKTNVYAMIPTHDFKHAKVMLCYQYFTKYNHRILILKIIRIKILTKTLHMHYVPPPDVIQ